MLGAAKVGLLRNSAGQVLPPVAGYTHWYDVADLATLWKDTAGTQPVTANGDQVARIDNKGSLGGNASQSSSTLRPLYDNTTYGSTSPFLKTDGTINTHGLTQTTGSQNWSNATIFFAAESRGNGTAGRWATKASSPRATLGASDNNDITFGTNTSLFTYVTGVTTMNTKRVFTAVTQNTPTRQSYTYVNTTASASDTSWTDFSGTDFTIFNEGTSTNNTIRIFEVIVYLSVLSSTNRNSVITYLKTKWGMP